jgi:hypothetical protein
MPESTLTLCQSRLYPPVSDFGFGLWILGHLRKLFYVQATLLIVLLSTSALTSFVQWNAQVKLLKS